MKKYLIVTIYLALICASIFISGCDRSLEPDHHEDMEKLVLLDRTRDTRTIIATWIHDTGWDVPGLPPLAVGGERLSLDVEVYNDHDEQVILDGSEYYIQYDLAQGAPTGYIDMSRSDLFHASYIHIYPFATGTTQIEFSLWHGDHPDAYTTPIAVTVTE